MLRGSRVFGRGLGFVCLESRAPGEFRTLVSRLMTFVRASNYGVRVLEWGARFCGLKFLQSWKVARLS